MSEFTKKELQEWAEKRCDDAGRLARALLAMTAERDSAIKQRNIARQWHEGSVDARKELEGMMHALRAPEPHPPRPECDDAGNVPVFSGGVLDHTEPCPGCPRCEPKCSTCGGEGKVTLMTALPPHRTVYTKTCPDCPGVAS